jgi:hypothetical protein
MADSPATIASSQSLERTGLQVGPSFFKLVSNIETSNSEPAKQIFQRIQIETSEFIILTQDRSLAGHPNVIVLPRFADLSITGDIVRIIGLLELPGRDVRIACRRLEFILPPGIQGEYESPCLGIDVTPELGHNGSDQAKYESCPTNAVAQPSPGKIRLRERSDTGGISSLQGSLQDFLRPQLLGIGKMLVETAPYGTDGGRGQHGSAGGTISVVTGSLVADEQVLLRADGAQGGMGGRGADGADGIEGGHQMGQQISVLVTENEGDGWPGVPGGHGGMGGEGGAGGRGGTVKLYVESILPKQPWADSKFKFLVWKDGSIVNQDRYAYLAHYLHLPSSYPYYSPGTPGYPPCECKPLTGKGAAIIVSACGGFGGSGGDGGNGGNGGKGGDSDLEPYTRNPLPRSRLVLQL